MSKTFREWTLDQALLLPPSVHDFCAGRRVQHTASSSGATATHSAQP